MALQCFRDTRFRPETRDLYEAVREEEREMREKAKKAMEKIQ